MNVFLYPCNVKRPYLDHKLEDACGWVVSSTLTGGPGIFRPETIRYKQRPGNRQAARSPLMALSEHYIPLPGAIFPEKSEGCNPYFS
jgi:hypothetical protein